MAVWLGVIALDGMEANNQCSNPLERPTADLLLSQHPFCELDPNYNFFDTELYAKIRGTY
jgi:hypothetical protein